MARDLAVTDRNALRLIDPQSDSEVVLYYRTPTTNDLYRYQTKIVKREGKKFRPNPEYRLEAGLAILTGVRTGDFTDQGVAISSDPGAEGYREDWKDLVKKGAPDLIDFLARRVFEGVRVGGDEGVEDLLEMDGEGDSTPH